MKPSPLFVLLALLALGGRFASAARGAEDGSAFRVRADFSAALNDDQGWAAALNENPAIEADRPFRLRFEVEHSADSAGGPYRLDYQRNGGEWAAVEAHDFPYPQRELEMEFAETGTGAPPVGWVIVPGDGAATVVADGPRKILRARAGRDTLFGLCSPPWPATEFGARFRLPARNSAGLGLLLGYVDTRNHLRVFLNPAAATIRVSRLVAGKETLLMERQAPIVPDTWLDLELKIEGGAAARALTPHGGGYREPPWLAGARRRSGGSSSISSLARPGRFFSVKAS